MDLKKWRFKKTRVIGYTGFVIMAGNTPFMFSGKYPKNQFVRAWLIFKAHYHTRLYNYCIARRRLFAVYQWCRWKAPWPIRLFFRA